MTLYEVLGVDRDASENQIRLAYRRTVQHWHPDRNPGNETEAHQRFIEAQLAYKTLSDANARQVYDSSLKRQADNTRASLADLFDLFERMLIDLFCTQALRFDEAVAVLVRQGFPAGVASVMVENAYRGAFEENAELLPQDPPSRDEHRVISKAIASAFVIAMLISIYSPGKPTFAHPSAEEPSFRKSAAWTLENAIAHAISTGSPPAIATEGPPWSACPAAFNAMASPSTLATSATQNFFLKIDETLGSDTQPLRPVAIVPCVLPGDEQDCSMPQLGGDSMGRVWTPSPPEPLPLRLLAAHQAVFPTIPALNERNQWIGQPPLKHSLLGNNTGAAESGEAQLGNRESLNTGFAAFWHSTDPTSYHRETEDP